MTPADIDVVRTWRLPVRMTMPDDEPSGPMTPSQPMPMTDMPDDSTDGPTTPDKQQMMGRSLGLMEIRFSVFGTWYEIDSFWEGTFLERTARGAFAKTISERKTNLPVLFNHGMDLMIGDKILGPTESLSEQVDSPVAQVSLFDTSYNRDLVPGLQAGVYGSSFTFRVVQDSWNDEPEASAHNPKGLPERTITEVRLLEAGPVTWPANPAATAGLRCVSGTDVFYEGMSRRDPHMVAELRSRVLAKRTAESSAAAPPPASEPVNSHSGDLARAIRLRRIREARLARLAALRRAS